MKYTANFDIQTYDADFAGAISNTTYVRWLDKLRTGWLDSIMPRSRQQADSLTLVVGRVEVDYLYSVGFYEGNGQISGVIEDVERGNTRVVFHASFWLGEKEVARAVQKTLLVNLATRRPARFPTDVARRLESTEAAVGHLSN